MRASRSRALIVVLLIVSAAARSLLFAQSPGLLEFVGESFHYADFTMAHGVRGGLPPNLVSTVKIRQAGFQEAMDTEAMFRKWFRILREERLLP